MSFLIKFASVLREGRKREIIGNKEIRDSNSFTLCEPKAYKIHLALISMTKQNTRSLVIWFFKTHIFMYIITFVNTLGG